MSNTFHINRLLSLIARQWISFGKIYLMAITIAAGVIAAFYGYALYELFDRQSLGFVTSSDALDFRAPLFVLLGMFFVTIISGAYFADYGQKPKAIFEVLIPASRLEKFLTAIFYTVVLCILSYIFVFILIDVAFVAYLRSWVLDTVEVDQAQSLSEQLAKNLPFFVNYDVPKQAPYFYFLPFLFNAIFLLGSIAYKNFQYIKTAVSLIVYIAIWCFGVVYIMKTLTDGSISVQRDSFWQDENHIFQVFLLVGSLVTIIFWGIAFLRLKEKEV